MTSTTAPPPDELDGALLLDHCRAAVTSYLILPSNHAMTAVVLWIAASHAVPAWNAAARLVIKAPEKRCGKSRLLDLIEALCHQPIMTTNASPSAVYRSIGQHPNDPPTLLIDESDAIFGPKAGDAHEDLRGLLNAGHQRGRPALRWDAGSRQLDEIATFAMVALAGIGAMPETIKGRAVIIAMRRRAPDETVQPYRARRDGPALHHLKKQLHTWIRHHLHELEAAAPELPLEDRAADTWEPLIAIADLAGGSWPTRARAAALALAVGDVDEENVSLRVRLLMDCRTAFGDATGIPTETLVSRLRDDKEAPWDTLGKNGLTARGLSAMLRDFGITSANRRWEDGSQTKGYQADQFADSWRRYCPAGSSGAPSVPSVPPSHAPATGTDSPSWDGWDGWDGRVNSTEHDRLHQLPPTPCLRRRHAHAPHLHDRLRGFAMTQSRPPQTPDLAGVIDLAHHRALAEGEYVRIPARVTYTVPEVAGLLGISRATTYVLLKTGQIPARRIGSRWIIACRRFNNWLEGETNDPGGER